MCWKIPLLLLFPLVAFCEDFLYKQPPREVRDVLDVFPIPAASVSPQREAVIFMQAVRYPPIGEVAQPMERLGSICIDKQTNDLHLVANYISYT